MLLNYQVLAIGLLSMIGGMAYVVTVFYRKENETARVHRGLRKYMQRKDYSTQEMS